MEPEAEPELAEEAVQAEKEALGKIVFAFQEYHKHAELEILRWERNYQKLPEHHKRLLPMAKGKFAAARQAAHVNYMFLQSMLTAFDASNNPAVPQHLDTVAAGEEAAAKLQTSNPTDVEKVRYVFKNLMRDWSAEGENERKQSYGKLLEELQRRVPVGSGDGQPPQVLIPGAGLARLCVEAAALGYEAQGNEYSYYMLLTASFMLNCTHSTEQWTIHPFLLNSCNNLSDENQLRSLHIPDVNPADMLPTPGLLSMCAGDFVEVYHAPRFAGSFDAVLTCFFIDTAHNVIEYMEVIHHVLRPGGVWVNLGPLLYHWADSHAYLGDCEMSVELSLADLMRVAAHLGFEQLHQETVAAPYNGDIRSMYQTVYSAALFSMRKGENGTDGPASPGSHSAAAAQPLGSGSGCWQQTGGQEADPGTDGGASPGSHSAAGGQQAGSSTVQGSKPAEPLAHP